MRLSFFSLLDRYENDAGSYPALYQQVLDQIVLADELGFDSYWIGEHHGQTTPGQVLACPHPAVLLAAAAKLTQRIGLNTAVANLALRHPLQVAEDYALVDVLSQGRLGLGIGRGSFPHEYAAIGQTASESFDRFEESWDIFQRLWRGESVTFQGRYYQLYASNENLRSEALPLTAWHQARERFCTSDCAGSAWKHLENAKLNVTPVQQPLPRHWFSAIKADSFVMRGRLAQPLISLPHITAKSFANTQKLVEDHRSHYLAAGGKSEDYELPLILYAFVAPTRAEALQTAVEGLRRYMKQQHPGSHEHIIHAIHHLKDEKLLWFGTPGNLIDVLEQFQASIDNRHFVFWSDFGGIHPELVLRSMRLIAEEVLPHFAK